MNPQPDQLTQAPDWIKDLILYEVASKGFTSPNGPESGNFDSLAERLPYLHELGVTGIWLTGHSLAHPRHFYNIWTQYACILPDQLDPSLGDAASFKRLIERAHGFGIKVLLDVITHGVMNDSPLITQHPEWFKGGSWGMTDFDWGGDHPDLDDWWVDCWVRYVADFGVDGYRLDVATYRPDLWSRIRQRCAALGHPIVVLCELGPAYAGASDFIQWGQRVSVNHGFVHDHPHLFDLAAAIQQEVRPRYTDFQVLIEYSDGCKASNHGEGEVALTVTIGAEEETLHSGPRGQGDYVIRELTLHVAGAPTSKSINNVTIRHPSNHWPWTIHGSTGVDFGVTVAGQAPDLRLTIPLLHPDGAWLSVQLSCHDNGWDGTPLDANPYAAQGSRFVFGYSVLLAPAVPIWMAGEEFNADYRPLPTHTPGLFGAGEPGRGRWLYASWLQWDQLRDPARAAMLDDVRRMIRIRRQQRELIYPLRVGQEGPTPVAVAHQASVKLPVPYLYTGNGKALLVAGNPHVDQEVDIRFDLTALALGLDEQQSIQVVDLWNERVVVAATVDELAQQTFTIARDKSPRGGLLVLSIF
jgi:hypothetical protein